MVESDSFSIEQQIQRYLPLIIEFTGGKIDAPTFKTRYLRLVKSGDRVLRQDIGDAVYKLFGDADYYEPRVYLRDSETLDDNQILQFAIVARDKLLTILRDSKSSDS